MNVSAFLAPHTDETAAPANHSPEPAGLGVSRGANLGLGPDLEAGAGGGGFTGTPRLPERLHRTAKNAVYEPDQGPGS